jgi:NAD(P)-dependent dehydrogenase (short-subunit alcohol dehydrogenase family)
MAITGGGSGIGAAIAKLAAAAGASVAILDLRDSENVTDSESVRFFPCDVTDPTAVEQALAHVADTFGTIHALATSAGINGVLTPIEDLHPDEWRQTLSVCLNGTFYTLRAAIPHLKREDAAVVLISSITGTRSFATEGAAAYAAAKAGVTALAQIAAVELGRLGVRVNAIAPGAVLDTRLWDERTVIRNLSSLAHERRIDAPLIGEGTTAADVADLALFLLGPSSRRISGAVVHIDAGQSLLGGGILKDATPIQLDPPRNPQLEKLR